VEQTKISSSSVGKRLEELEAALRQLKREVPPAEDLRRLAETVSKFDEIRDSLRALEDLELVTKLETSSVEDEVAKMREVLKDTKAKVDVLAEAVKNIAKEVTEVAAAGRLEGKGKGKRKEREGEVEAEGREIREEKEIEAELLSRKGLKGLKDISSRIEELQVRVADLERRTPMAEEKEKGRLRLFAPKEKEGEKEKEAKRGGREGGEEKEERREKEVIQVPAPSLDLEPIKADLSRLDRDLRDEIAEIRLLVGELQEKVERAAKEAKEEAKIKEKVSELSEEDKKALADIRAKIERLSEQSAAKVLRAEESVHIKNVKATLAEIRKTFDALKAETDSKLGDMSARLESMDKKLKKETSGFGDLEKRIEKKIDDVKKLEDFVADSVAKFDTSLRQLEQDLAADMTQIEENLKKSAEAVQIGVATDIAKVEDRYRKETDSLRADIAEAKKSLSDGMLEAERRLVERIDKTTTEKSEKAASEVRSALESYKSGIEAWKSEVAGRLDASEKNVANFRREITAMVDEANNKLRADLEKMAEPIKNLSEAESRMEGRLESALRSIDSKFKANAAVLEKMPAMAAEIQKTKAEAADLVKKLNAVTELENYIADSIARFDSSLRQFESALRQEDEKLKQEDERLKASLAAASAALESRMAELSKSVDAKADDLSRSIAAKADEISRSVDSKIDELSKSVSAKVGEAALKAEKTMAKAEELEERAKELDALRADMSVAQEELEILKTTRSDLIRDVEEILSKQLDDLMKKGHFDALREELYEKTDKKLAQITAATEALEAARKAVEERIDTLESKIQQAADAATEQRFSKLREENQRLREELEAIKEAYFALADKVEADILRAPVVIE